MIQPCLAIHSSHHLTIGGADTVALAQQYGTPLYVMDEATLRERCRIYRETLSECFGEGSLPLYASKALCVKEIYRIVKSEGLGADVVSSGELYTAIDSGFDPAMLWFHGNNKTDADILFAIRCKIGHFVVDNREELEAIERIAGENALIQPILLRITPGIDPHTHQKIITGNVDSKFGSAIVTGQAEDIVRLALSLPHIRLDGFHCHIGSQIFESDPFIDAAGIMLRFIADMKAKFGYQAEYLNLGGGFGVPYVEGHPTIDYAARIREVSDAIHRVCGELSIPQPKILMEPGRSLVAAAGITLYTVGSVKEIPGFRTYVSVDGGMPDNPRYALYQSEYEAVAAARADAPKDLICTLAGRCCESGDLIGEGMPLQSVSRGDIVAVLVTGAYNYAMASNYNRLPRPRMVMIRDGMPRVIVRPETFTDLLNNDI